MNNDYENYPSYERPQANRALPKGEAIKYLVFGILSLELPVILGIIFGALAKNNGKRLMREYPDTWVYAISNVARILGLAGFIIGIVTTVLIAIYIPIWLWSWKGIVF